MPDLVGVQNNINLPKKIVFGKGGQDGNGGDGGTIVLVTQKLSGNGKITADGGNGKVGGKGGHIHVQSIENNFQGEISAKGGESTE